MSKILITGSNGLLGQKLVDHLQSEGRHEIIATSFSENIAFNKDGYIFELMDITNPVEIGYILNRYNPDIILHTAGITQVSSCEKNKEEAWKTNVVATETLARACNKKGSHFILLSTDFVFDGQRGPYIETDPTGPLNYYGQTKLDAEKVAQKNAKKLAIIRTCLVYGTNFKMTRSNFLLWVKNSLENDIAIKVNNDQWRTPTLAEDLAVACSVIANTGAEGIYHIAGSQNIRLLDYAYLIADFYKLNKQHITEVSSAELTETGLRPFNSGLRIDKAIAELAYKPHNLEEGLQIVAKQLEFMESFED